MRRRRRVALPPRDLRRVPLRVRRRGVSERRRRSCSSPTPGRYARSGSSPPTSTPCTCGHPTPRSTGRRGPQRPDLRSVDREHPRADARSRRQPAARHRADAGPARRADHGDRTRRLSHVRGAPTCSTTSCARARDGRRHYLVAQARPDGARLRRDHVRPRCRPRRGRRGAHHEHRRASRRAARRGGDAGCSSPSPARRSTAAARRGRWRCGRPVIGAQQLYRRFGFVPAGVRKQYYENGIDAIVMWCHDIQSDDYRPPARGAFQ